MNIYQLDAGGYWTGAIAEINEDQGAPAGWVLSPPPELGAGEYAAWSGRWSVTTMQGPGPSVVEATKLYEQAVQAKLDDAARAARYDSIATAVSYAEEPRCPSSRRTASPSGPAVRWSGRMPMSSWPWFWPEGVNSQRLRRSCWSCLSWSY